MKRVISIGQVPWCNGDLLSKLEEFTSLYEQRPILDNSGGMKVPHLFATWFVLRMLKPKVIIESGVWKGQGTWLIEQACPDAELYCIDLNFSHLQYKSKRAHYLDKDFSTIDWSHVAKDDTVLFFDDHQNAYERIKTSSWFGFKHLLFEDNYPPSQGDCYSLKKAFMNAGFKINSPGDASLKTKVLKTARSLAGKQSFQPAEIPPNNVDARYLMQNLQIYYEIPPVFRAEKTRWNDTWNDEEYPTPEALLSSVTEPFHQVFFDQAIYYTWFCYAKLK